jgi:dCMP deaminase
MSFSRPSLELLLLNFAASLAERATCSRLQVGAVLTDVTMREVFAYGYNGNARGFPNQCDSKEPGLCGCLHAEMNALVKSGARDGQTLFTSVAPCIMCAKASVNAGVRRVVFRKPYRSFTGLSLLVTAGVKCTQLDATDVATTWDAGTIRGAIDATAGL